MSKRAHFFDINCLLKSNQKAWVVDKSNPNIPLAKISPSDLKLMRSGIYAKKGNKIKFNNETYYLSDEWMNKFKLLALKNSIDFPNIVITLQEFYNTEIADNLDFEIDLTPLLKFKNEILDIYIVSSQQTMNVLGKLIDEMKEDLRENGIVVKQFYFLNENFLNQNSSENKFKQMRLLLQHLVGFKSDGDKFTDVDVEKYDTISYYDTSKSTFDIEKDIIYLLKIMIRNTDKGLSDVIREDLGDDVPQLEINKLQDNEFNPMSTIRMKIIVPKIIKAFESFTKFNSYLL